MSKSHTTLSLTNTKSKKRKPQKSDFTPEQKWSVAKNILLELLSDEIKENTQQLIENDMLDAVDLDAILITSWLDYLASYYCYLADETAGAKTKKEKTQHKEIDDYASRAVDAYMTARYALLYFVDEEDKSE